MIDLLAAAALAAASPGALTPQPLEASPAIYVVHDQDTTIYLFGTFHVLDGKSDWFEGPVRAAFDQSSELALETLIPEGPIQPAAFQPSVARVPVQPAGGVPMMPSASFLATTKLAIDAGRSQGMKVGNGADMVLRRAAEHSGKQVEGLETFDFQLDMFNRMPPAPVARPKPGDPVENGDSVANLSHSMAELQTAWKHGDQQVFVRMLDQLLRASPETYRMMFTERNARWAEWIEGRMNYPGTVFVAVGAGHLAGKDSVLVRLAEQGIESTRLN